MPSKHAADNVSFGVRARLDWIVKLDAAARAAGESRMAYIHKAVEERMAREGPDNGGEGGNADGIDR